MGLERQDGLVEAARTADPEALEAAIHGFRRAFPHHSAQRRLYWTQALFALGLIAALIWCVRADPWTSWRVAHALLFALFLAAIGLRLAAAAMLTPPHTQLAAPASGAWPTYSILCPLYREAGVVADLVAALQHLDYPPEALDIQLLIEGDDVETLAHALAAARAPQFSITIVPAAAPRTKPKALNVGLAYARGGYIAVYDAEDRPHPQQLRAALAAFEAGGPKLACVQAPLVIDNAPASWIAGQFAVEYAIQFGEILPLLARIGSPFPLGGSSNHFRADVLRACCGWDPHNVTEDADLGYRLARAGWRSDVIGLPTWEEAPVTLKAWLSQRTRWIKGHLQTWLVLMRTPLRTARELGARAFWIMHLHLLGGLIASFAHGPLALWLLAAALAPADLLGPADFALAISGYMAAVFAALTACALSGDLRHAIAALTMPLYWPLSSLAAARALWEFALRPHHWAKTQHGASGRARAPFFAATARQQAAAPAKHRATS